MSESERREEFGKLAEFIAGLVQHKVESIHDDADPVAAEAVKGALNTLTALELFGFPPPVGAYPTYEGAITLRWHDDKGRDSNWLELECRDCGVLGGMGFSDCVVSLSRCDSKEEPKP